MKNTDMIVASLNLLYMHNENTTKWILHKHAFLFHRK